MTSSRKKFEEMVKDLIQLVHIEMKEILQVEMAAKDDAAIVHQLFTLVSFPTIWNFDKSLIYLNFYNSLW